MDLTIVIVNWNSADYAIDCVKSIVSSTQGLDFEIVVVDNASSDHSLEILQKELPNVRLVRSATNIGFAKGNNLGFQFASGRHVLFLNPDTFVLGPAISRMYASLESSPAVGAVGCKLLNADSTIQTSCIQPFPNILNQLADIERLKVRYPNLKLWKIRPLFDGHNGNALPVEAVSGACLMVKRDVFNRIGLFSEDYFMYGEDLDLCYKIRRAGWQVCYVGGATVMHYGGKSTARKGIDGFQTVLMRESIYTFMKKFRGPLYAELYRFTLLLSALIRLSVLIPFWVLSRARPKRERVILAIRKWHKILGWAAGQGKIQRSDETRKGS